jgi:hypothetical protein
MGRRAVPVLLLLVSFLLFSAEAKKEKDVTELQIGVKVGYNGFGERPCCVVEILLFNCWI